jgi:nitroreductase
MDLYDVMRTAFSAREFTADAVPDDVLERVFEHARFAPSGGNRQGWHVIVIRDPATKSAVADLAVPAAKRYLAQVRAGENPWNSLRPPGPSAAEIEATAVSAGLIEPTRSAPVLLVVCVDLGVVAAVDQDLDRVGVVGGASIYPFAWNILLALRNEGFGGVLTTMPIAMEPALRDLLGIPETVAVAAVMPVGRPATSLSRLRRKPVAEFLHSERW